MEMYGVIACDSQYFKSLDPESKKRNRTKLSCIGFIDPYSDFGVNDPFTGDDDILPAVSYPDIVNYLLFTPSAYTSEDMKSYKSLQAYNQVVEGWVRNVLTMEINNLRVVKGQVS